LRPRLVGAKARVDRPGPQLQRRLPRSFPHHVLARRRADRDGVRARRRPAARVRKGRAVTTLRPRCIVVATTNPGKLKEVSAVLDELGIAVRPLDPDLPEPVEDADTFEGNARIK